MSDAPTSANLRSTPPVRAAGVMAVAAHDPRALVRAATDRLRQARLSFYRWAALPGDRWVDPSRNLRGCVIGFDHKKVRLEVITGPGGDQADGWPELSGDANDIQTIDPSDPRWKPLP